LRYYRRRHYGGEELVEKGEQTEEKGGMRGVKIQLKRYHEAGGSGEKKGLLEEKQGWEVEMSNVVRENGVMYASKSVMQCESKRESGKVGNYKKEKDSTEEDTVRRHLSLRRAGNNRRLEKTRS